MPPKHQVHFGVRFCREDRSGYYKLSGTGYAHRFVWEQHNGPIPEGMHIHHKDCDKSNNEISNLEMLPISEHLSLHMQERIQDPAWMEFAKRNLDNIRHLTKEWHSSPEGLQWHREHGRKVFRNIAPVEHKCEHCEAVYRTKPKGSNRFCSNNCKSAWRRAAGLDDETRVCAFCSEFYVVNKYSKSEVCGQACNNRLRYKRKSENSRP